VNDLETRLRSLSFREPPPGLRGAALAPRVSRWRTPPVAAWAALAAVWLALLAVDRLLEAGAKLPVIDSPSIATLSLDGPTPLAFHLRIAAGKPAL
jgi:hypothetical protein